MFDPDAYLHEIDEAARWLSDRGLGSPAAALVLGSGLGGVASLIEEAKTFPFSQIPGFPVSTVAGHAGELVHGSIAGREVCLLRGRAHLYEGVAAHRVVFPVRVLAALSVPVLVLTNAAGGVAPRLAAGDVMLLTDHINLTGANPLTGPNLDRLGPRFPDLSDVYTPRLRVMAREAARDAGVTLQEGVYAALTGPSYETPAEVRMLATLGADAVGMSTVPEAIAAAHAGMEVAAFSMIANPAAGLTGEALSHDDVLAACGRAGGELEKVLLGMLGALSEP